MTTSIQSSLFERMVALQRDLHRHPELSGLEHRTTARIIQELDRLGIPYHRLLETGVAADIAGPPNVPAVALRADIDALPVREETGLGSSSQVDGVMHACGHDAHTAMLVGAAELLVSDPDPLPAPVRLIFQPAEETGTGARAMIDAGVLEGVGAVFGGHVDGNLPTGVIAVAEGTVNASSDSFRISIQGRQGHAARPHETVDAVVVGSLIVMAVQTIVSREIDPSHPSVLSIGRFEAGEASNVIAGTAILEGTIRAQEPEVRNHLLRSLERVCTAVGKLHEASVAFELQECTPPVVNREPMVGVARQAAESTVGPDRVRRAVRGANMGGEDFSWYLQNIPGCYVRLGIRAAGSTTHPAHSGGFRLDEEVLTTGALWLAEVARLAGRSLAAPRDASAATGGER